MAIDQQAWLADSAALFGAHLSLERGCSCCTFRQKAQVRV